MKTLLVSQAAGRSSSRSLGRKASSSLLCLAGAALFAAGCAEDGAPDKEEITGEESSAIASPTSANGMLLATNGSKVIADAYGNLHMVYWSGSYVRYIRSSDGVNWSTPQNLDAGENSSIGIANGRLGVVYVKSGALYYVSKALTGTGAWSAPALVTNDPTILASTSYTPSIVGYGADMYVAWQNGARAVYAKLSGAAAPAAAVEVVNQTSICGSIAASAFPSIAVTPKSATDPSPVVRVAYTEDVFPAAACTSRRFGLFVSERGSTGVWSDVYSGLAAVPNSPAPQPTAVSLAAVPESGDFYLGYSAVVNGAESTVLLHQNRWHALWASNGWGTTTLLPRRSRVNVVGGFQSCAPVYRVAVSDYTQGSANYGPVTYRTGKWTGVAASPSWTDPTPMLVSYSGHYDEALFWEKGFGNHITGITRRVTSTWDEHVGTGFPILEDRVETSGWSYPVACSTHYETRSLSASTCVTVERASGGGVSDAEIVQDGTEVPYGEAESASVGTEETTPHQALLRFDLSEIPADVVITGAALTLTRKSTGDGRVDVYPIVAPWEENEVTWASFDGAHSPKAVASYDEERADDDAPVTVDLTAQVSAWVSGAAENHGVALSASGKSMMTFHTSESADPTLAPRLDVCFAR
ncbi:MAG: DNRLRE domain-containing protein [Polyangiaceae bacterium]